MPAQYSQRRKSAPSSGGGPPQYYSIQQVVSDLRAMNSAILIISQKIEHLVRNEKILSRNIIVLNKRLKEIEAGLQGGAGNTGEKASQLEQIMAELSAQASRHSLELSGISSQLSSLDSKFASKAEFQETKYIVQAINPLEFVTFKQVSELIDQKLGQKPSQPAQPEGRSAEEKPKKKK